jgi:hypothetical protein
MDHHAPVRRNVECLASRIPIGVAAGLVAGGRLGPRRCERQHWWCRALARAQAMLRVLRSLLPPSCMRRRCTAHPGPTGPRTRSRSWQAVRMESRSIWVGSEMADVSAWLRSVVGVAIANWSYQSDGEKVFVSASPLSLQWPWHSPWRFVSGRHPVRLGAAPAPGPGSR